MRPKRNVLLIGKQFDLAFTLRVVARETNVIAVEDVADMNECLRNTRIDLIIIDRRGALHLAMKALLTCARAVPTIRTIVIAGHAEPLYRAAGTRSEFVLRDGCDFIDRLRTAMALGLARKRGPARKHQPCLS